MCWSFLSFVGWFRWLFFVVNIICLWSLLGHRNYKAFVGHFWAIFMVSLIERIAQRLRRIILLHFGLVIFRFHYWKNPKPLIFMVLGLFLILETPRYCKKSKENPKSFRWKHIVWGNLIFWKSEILIWGRKTGRKIPKIHLISSRKHEMECWEYGITETSKFEALELWFFK